MQLNMGDELFPIVSNYHHLLPTQGKKGNLIHFMVKHIHADQKPLKNVWHSSGRDEEAGHGGGRERPMPVRNNHENGHAITIVSQMCLFFNSNAKIALFSGQRSVGKMS